MIASYGVQLGERSVHQTATSTGKPRDQATRNLDPVRYRIGQYALRFHARDTGSNRQWERIERLILVR